MRSLYGVSPQGEASIDGRIIYDTNLNVRNRLRAALLFGPHQ
jgi:hypothetical protein